MNLFEEAKRAAAQVALLPDETRADALDAVADAIEAQQDKLLSANAEDLLGWIRTAHCTTACA